MRYGLLEGATGAYAIRLAVDQNTAITSRMPGGEPCCMVVGEKLVEVRGKLRAASSLKGLELTIQRIIICEKWVISE
jgi:hypothetical protein